MLALLNHVNSTNHVHPIYKYSQTFSVSIAGKTEWIKVIGKRIEESENQCFYCDESNVMAKLIVAHQVDQHSGGFLFIMVYKKRKT